MVAGLADTAFQYMGDIELLTNLGNVYIFSCVVFEDAVVGIQAGQAAGMKVIAVATTNSLDKLLDANLPIE